MRTPRDSGGRGRAGDMPRRLSTSAPAAATHSRGLDPDLKSVRAANYVKSMRRDLWKVSADQVQLKEVLDNLCANAADAMPQGGCILIETENVVLDAELLLRHPEAQPGEYVRLRVQDPGEGMAEEVRARMFEPFFTTKEMGQGTGLGLAIVFGIVEQHNGWIECSSAAGQGTVFDIFLPRYGQNFPALPLPAKARRPHAGPPAILLADDEPMVRELGQKILAAQGYRVLLAEDGRHALDLFRQHRDEIDLVILDLAMSRLSGKDAWQEMLRIDPQVRVLFSSGYFAEDLMAEDSRVVGFINKPYHPKELTDMVRGALEKGH